MRSILVTLDSVRRNGDTLVEDRHTLYVVARIAAILAVIYAVPHIWWGVGVDWLAPADMSGDTGLGSHAALRFFAFYGMGFLAFLSALLTLAMIQPVRLRFPTGLILLHGWGTSVLLLIRGGIGLTETALIYAGVRDCPFAGCRQGEPGRDSIGMTGLFWEPLFVIWGLALLTSVALWTRFRKNIP